MSNSSKCVQFENDWSLVVILKMQFLRLLLLQMLCVSHLQIFIELLWLYLDDMHHPALARVHPAL